MQKTLPLLDIHLPEPVSWWPLAPGWWLMGLLTVLLLTGLWLFATRLRKIRLKKIILCQMNTIYTQYEQDADATKLLQAVSVLMKRSCLSYYPRVDSAGLSGQAWLQYLDATTAHKGFEHGAGKILATAPYRPTHSSSDTHLYALRELCTQWLATQTLTKQVSTGRSL